MDLHAELVEFLKYADVEGKKLTWNLQVNASTVTVKFIWIKDENSIATIGKVASLSPKKKKLSPSTRKRNTQCLNQWKAKRYQTVVDLKVDADAQTENHYKQIDDTTQTDQQSGHNQKTRPSEVFQKKERSTQSRSHIKGKTVNGAILRNPGRLNIMQIKNCFLMNVNVISVDVIKAGEKTY